MQTRSGGQICQDFPDGGVEAQARQMTRSIFGGHGKFAPVPEHQVSKLS